MTPETQQTQWRKCKTAKRCYVHLTTCENSSRDLEKAPHMPESQTILHHQKNHFSPFCSAHKSCLKITQSKMCSSTTNNTNKNVTQKNKLARDEKTGYTISMSTLSFTAKTPTTALNTGTPTSFLPRSSENKSETILLDKALDIVDSPLIRSQRGRTTSLTGRIIGVAVSRRKGSLMCSRRLNELLLDNGDRLSEMMRNCEYDFYSDSDSESDSDMEE